MKPLSVAVSVMLFCTSAWAAPEEFIFEGVATPISGDRLLYREQHRVTGECADGQWRPNRHFVEYHQSDQAGAFASKALSYPEGLLTPEVDFRQPGVNERLQVTVKADQLDVQWQAPGQGEREWTVDITPELVVDAGFDHFIRTHWRALTNGDSVAFRFLAPTRGKAYGFVAEPSPEPIPGAAHSFRIRPSSLVMRMLVDPIRLGYQQDGRLSHYIGLGNIRRTRDENYEVAIRYQTLVSPPCPLLPDA